MLFPFILFERMRLILRRNLARLIVFVLAVIVYGTLSEYALERSAPGSGVKNLFDSLWFVMQTITTVGYGDTPVVTTLGRANAIVLMVVGIGILSFFGASFASLLIDYSTRTRLGERRVRLKDHVVICNWNAIAEQLAKEILKEKSNIVLLGMLDKSPVDGVEFVKGSCLHVADLQKANVAHAESAIVLSDVLTDGELASAIDAKTILGVMNIRQASQDIHIVVELLKSDSAENARIAGADEIVIRGQVSAKLLSRGALDPGTIDIVDTILTSKSGEEIFEQPIPSWATGKTYGEVVPFYMERNATPIALRSSKGLKINPRTDTIIDHDSIIYIARSKIKT